MPKGHKPAPPPNKMLPQPADCRDAIQWFVNTVGLYSTSARGLVATDFTDDQESILEAAIINLKSRGINPVVITGDALYRQGEYLWEQAVQHTRFGRPLASQFELEMTGADVLILRNVEAPETAHHLWYLFHHVFYPRALAGKPLLMTTPLGLEEFHKYGAACDDLEFAGRKLTWQKLAWLIEATCVDMQHYRTLREEGLPPMLKAEHLLLNALKERGLAVQPQHVLGDYMLDIAIFDRERKLDIECDVLTSLDSTGANAWQAKKNLLLLSDGWKVLKFTAAEIVSNIHACVDVVEEVWTQGRKRSSIGRLLSGQAAASIPELPVDDDVQRLVITHGAGPCAVEGGAGTGKSSCVIHRVAYLLAQGVNPDRILVISHSHDTVKALKSSVEAISDRQAVQRVSFHSWHDLGLKILKENLGAVKRKPPLKVESNPQKVIQRLLTKYKKDLDPVTLELSEELDEFTIASLISLYKANLITPKHLKERSKSDVDELVSKVFQGYEDQLQKINRIDRDDMVSLAAQVLVDQADLRTKYQYQYDYVLVDEYQDTTAAGDLLARILAMPQDNLYITGDEDEAIYESKGGLPRLMSDVSIRLPNARCYVLEKNWRCHPAIVDHARQLIANLTRRRIQKDMVSGWGAAPTTAIIGPQFSESEQAEAEWVADEVSILIDSGRNPQDIAVLYRYHRYGIIIEEALSRRSIRCLTSHPEAGLIPDEVGDVMAFLKLVMDPDGPKARESFERVCQLRVKEVDPKLSSTIASFAEANNLSYLKAVEIYSEAVAEQSCLDLSQLVRIIRTMHQENLPPAETISLLKRTQRLSDYYRAVKVPPGVNYEPLRKLAQLEEEARKYKTVSEFVKAQTAVPAKGSPSSGLESSVDHVVHILTLHEAKGKEFSVVFLVGLAEGLFPADSATDLEEERRLCYVGMTRAKELLYLSFPSIFNNVGLQPSSFLVEARLMVQQPTHIPAPTLPPMPPQAVIHAVPAQPVRTPAPSPKAPPQPVQAPRPSQAPQPIAPQAAAPIPVQAPRPMQAPAAVPQPQPQVAAFQPEPQIAVPQPQPQVQPQVVVSQPQPQVVASQPQQPVATPQPLPQVATTQPQPQVASPQPQPQVSAPHANFEAPQQPPPQVTVPQTQAPVVPQPRITAEQPQANIETTAMQFYELPANTSSSSSPTQVSRPAAADLHKAFQEQLLGQHALQQREIAAAFAAAEVPSPNAPNDQEPARRHGRRGKQAEPVIESLQEVGPVQAALQRRNKFKQSGQELSEPISIPTPVAQLGTSPQVNTQPVPSNMVPTSGLIDQPIEIKADLSISHDAIIPEPLTRYTGLPPAGKRRGAPAEKEQSVQAEPVQLDQPTSTESFQQAPVELVQASNLVPAPEVLSGLTDDVPPGVVLHTGPVPSKRRKNSQPSEQSKEEDPNQQPTSFAVPEAELIASYDYTLPLEASPVPDMQAPPQEPAPPQVYAEPQVYVEPERYEPPHSYPGAGNFAPPAAAQLHTSHILEVGAPEHQAPTELIYELPPEPHALLEPRYESEDAAYNAAAAALLDSEQQHGVANATAALSPQEQQYNYAAPDDPALTQLQEEQDFEHRPKCNGCGTYLEVGSQFCGECGYRLEARIPGCHLCGSPLEPSAKFCGECGSKRVESRPTPPLPRPMDSMPDQQSEEFEAYMAQSAPKPTQRSWVVKLLKLLEN